MPSPLTVTPRVEDDIAILDLSGTLTLGPALVNLRNTARQLLGSSKLKGVIVQVGAVTQTDSSGLGELTVVYTLATKKGCALRLVNVKPELRKLLTLTRLDGLLMTSADLASAKSEIKKNSR